MINVKVLGGHEAEETEEMLKNFYGLGAETDASLKLLVMTSYHKMANKLVCALAERDMLLINADDENIHKVLLGNKAPVITFGLNSKVCVTRSSVVTEQYETVQYCVQRAFPTFSGKTIEQQEFAIDIVNCEHNIYAILACVTTALVCDIPLEVIAGSVIR